MNEIDQNTSKWKLEQCNYRTLQQKAKAMSLPSNVKKMYLIELIHTKMHGTPSEVDIIINRVKWERQKSTVMKNKQSKRKTRVQADEITSTSILKSPPISATPRRAKIIVRCNPLTNQSLIKYSLAPIEPRPSRAKTTHSNSLLANPARDHPKRSECERVLRNRSKLHPPEAYRDLISIDSNINDSTERRQNLKSLRIYSRDTEPRRYANNHSSILNVNKCVMKHRPSILAGKDKPKAGRSSQSLQLVSSSVQLPAEKRRRLLSGIEPITPKPIPKTTYNYVRGGIGIRNRDGTYTKIKALVQKSHSKPPNTSMSVANMAIEYPIATTESLTYNYIIDTPSSISNYQSQEIDDFYATYANSSKLSRRRISTVAFRRQSVINVEEALPRIHEAFSMFGNLRSDVTQPLYVQVAQDSERFTAPTPQLPAQPLLSIYYNCDRAIQAWSHAPLLPVTTTSGTVTVNTTAVITTAKVQVPTTNVCNIQSNYSSAQSVGYPYDSYYDYLNLWEQDLNMREMGLQELNHTGSTDSSLAMLASQVSTMDSSGSVSLGAMVTLPESEIEDALELISQDGDYMERIGMDEKILCPFCVWTGPYLMLEHHIRKEHASQIHSFPHTEWNVTLTLGSLTSGVHCTLAQCAGALCALRALCQGTALCVQISSISSSFDAAGDVTITTYNKVTGEPHTWRGRIPSYTALWCLDDPESYLQVDLSKLDLLPNSANLKLINNELVSDSPGRVVCGRPELDDIHIIVFVNF